MRPLWSRPLANPVNYESRKAKASRTVRTLAEAAKLALANKRTGHGIAWQTLAAKLVTAAETGAEDDILAATRQLERALLLDGNEDMRLAMRPPQKSLPRGK